MRTSGDPLDPDVRAMYAAILHGFSPMYAAMKPDVHTDIVRI